MSIDLWQSLRRVAELQGSDLHLKVGSPPAVRIAGTLRPLEGAAPLAPEDTEHALDDMLTDTGRLEEFAAENEVDFAFEMPGVARFRVNAFRQRSSISIACRLIPFSAGTIPDLGLPDVVRELAEEPRGIILVTGTTGSGKSTTLAAMVDHVNTTVARHIVTIEDPIEFLHHDKRSIINQREIGSDTRSFHRALRRVLRQDPDIILIGEIRDEETVRTALSAAETGHLVLSTLHTIDAAKTVDRIVGVFPKDQEPQIRTRFAQSFRYVISQRLLPKTGGGRVAVLEILKSTMRTRDYVMKGENEGRSLTDAMHDGSVDGMQTFDDQLEKLWQQQTITKDVAMAYATNPTNLALRLTDDQAPPKAEKEAEEGESMLSMLE
ncbi:MAG TPA: type IV pilus twitching motility protein PilT [Vicinamibacterales bacterium]